MRDLKCKRYQQLEIKGVRNVGNIEISAFWITNIGFIHFYEKNMAKET